MAGPLKGMRVIEFVGIGPGPFCAMLLADMGAEVIRVHKKGGHALLSVLNTRFDVLARGKRSLAIDLKQQGATEAVMLLIERADVVIEGFRPGVMERLGLGPELCFQRNPRLVFGRMTGWGQTGILAASAGHDINYLSLSGVLNAIGPRGAPAIPLNLVGDFGGGGLLIAFGIVCAVLEARQSGQGQVVDASMTDGAALLASAIYGYKAAGIWSNKREDNLLDGGAHFYCCYECADGKYMAVGAIEPQFYEMFLNRLGIDDVAVSRQMDKGTWRDLKRRIAAIFKTKSRDEWAAVFEGTDSCCTPVLDWDEAVNHKSNIGRYSFIDIAGIRQPRPAPRFSRTTPSEPTPPAYPGEHTEAIFADWGVDSQIVASLRERGVI